MIIKLANGTELNPISAMGGARFVQGANRDALTFVFAAETSLDELDGIFTAENCATITIVEGENEYIHNNYAIRVELKREPVEVTPVTDTAEAVIENRVFVTMAQRTYTESQLVSLTETVDVLVMESLLG